MRAYTTFVQYPQSGVLVLLLRLAQELYLDSTEEVLVTLDLLSRLVSFNMVIIPWKSLFQLFLLVNSCVNRLLSFPATGTHILTQSQCIICDRIDESLP